MRLSAVKLLLLTGQYFAVGDNIRNKSECVPPGIEVGITNKGSQIKHMMIHIDTGCLGQGRALQAPMRPQKPRYLYDPVMVLHHFLGAAHAKPELHFA